MIQFLQVADSVSVDHTHIVVDNLWFWIALVEFILILFLLERNSRRKNAKLATQAKLKSESLSEEIDINNVINSSFHATELYDQLKRICHPDRFTDPIKKEIADRIFQSITENKRDYKRLQQIKIQAIKELNVKL